MSLILSMSCLEMWMCELGFWGVGAGPESLHF